MRALNIAASGMLAQQMNVEVISNNIANMNTTGFKRQRAEFQDLLYQTVERVGAASGANGSLVPTGIQLGVGVRAGGVYRISEQGNLQASGNRFDLAIQGRGYFRIELPDGTEGVTRAGAFQLNDQGELVTQEGYRVLPNVTIPTNAVDVIINEKGQVQTKLAGQIDFQQVGQLELAIFPNEAGLEALGNNLLRQSPASGNPNISPAGEPGFGTLRQGFLETANVNPVSEITSLITAQRAYEMNSKVIQTAEEMMSTTSQMR